MLKTNAYVFSTLASIVAFADNFFNTNSNDIKACKYAYNMLKHNHKVITFVELNGGFSFPFTFPLLIPPIDIVWLFQNFKCNHVDQKDAFKNLFDGNPVLSTLEPIICRIIHL